MNEKFLTALAGFLRELTWESVLSEDIKHSAGRLLLVIEDIQAKPDPEPPEPEARW